MSLADYQKKRNFARTPEPQGRVSKTSLGRFVIHKHAARRLHYDLRLEIDGTLRSWAVPKGPCLDPAEKRLAVQTEDHPLEYLDFEGVIPPGEYGAGTIIVWDRGEWTPEGDLAASLRKGQLKIQFAGQKLQGRWALVKMKPRPGEPDRNWLFFKERGDSARPLANGDILQELPHSVLSGRTIEEVAGIAQQSETNHSRRTPRPTAAQQQPSPRIDTATIPGAAKAPLPTWLDPQLATVAASPPDGDRWLHEIKFDGYRLLCFVDDGKVRLLTRRHNDWTRRFPHLVTAAQQLPVQSAILDGEVVGLLPSGASSFPVLQAALKQLHPESLVYFVFDLLYVDGFDLRRTPLEHRKAALARVLGGAGQGPLQYVDHVDGHGPRFFAECRRMGLEGTVSKRRDRPFRPGRTPDWLKSKCVQRDEFVIGGFTEPSGSRTGLGSVLVGVFDEQEQLVYAGRVGTGFDEKSLKDLRRTLGAIERKNSPFVGLPRDKVERGTHWVEPQLVAQVQYAGWSADELLWHPVFQGVREDVAASSVVRNVTERRAGRRSPESRTPAARQTVEISPLAEGRLQELAHVRMTHPERVMYAGPQVTKLDLARYYASIADWILPHIVDRPLSLVRCPEGQGTSAFFQKHPGIGTPKELQRVRIDGEEHLMIQDLGGLVSLVQIGVLEIHPWGARGDRPDRPDRLIFDLDPDEEVPWHRVIATALRLRDLLQAVGLTTFVKVTGGKGLHIVLPIERRSAWSDAKQFTQAVARQLVAEQPAHYTTSNLKQARRGRIFIDCNRNSQGATAVAPYSTRNHPGATVAVPLNWSELSEDIAPDQFTVQNLVNRLAALPADPWADITTIRQTLSARAWKAFRR